MKRTTAAFAALAGIVLVSWSARAQDSVLMEGAHFCLSYAGIQSAEFGMNGEQLRSIGCIEVDREVRVVVHDRWGNTSNYKRVDIVLPEQVIQGWAWVTSNPRMLRGLIIDRAPVRTLEDALPPPRR